MTETAKPFNRLTFLGTGTSTGVPVIGCDCAVCVSTDVCNRRSRSSIWFQSDEISVLVDSGPDLRMQALRAGIRKVDAVLYTHGHMDHVVGFDELRAFCWDRDLPLPLYANAGCMATLQTMFAWAFAETNIYKGYIKPGPIVFHSPFSLGSLQVTPLPVMHGAVETNGFLFQRAGMQSLAYVPDVKYIPDETMTLLERADILILDALHHKSHPTHMSVREAVSVIEQLPLVAAYLTHCSHEVEHVSLEKSLPPHVKVAYDTLTLEL